MRKFFSLVAMLLALNQSAKAQQPYTRFFVAFADKKNCGFSPLKPQEFLSAESLRRRENQGIPISMADLPLSPSYLQLIKQSGALILGTSKWLNGVVIEADSMAIDLITHYEFVTEITPTGYKLKTNKKTPKKLSPIVRIKDYKREADRYGTTANQIDMLNLRVLHHLGFNAKDINLAIFDGGFQNVDYMPAFDSLFANHRLIYKQDVVETDSALYESSFHGTNVLSCIAANMPGLAMGTGYNANIYLFKTEDVNSEMPIEEYNWLIAAETADSLGVQVINSSLGYYKFDDQAQSHTYNMLTGNTTIITQAANLAAQRGILVVNSAGNEGSNEWRMIAAPADASNILTVGAVDRHKKKASFSSFGPSASGQIKPDVAARGSNAYVSSPYGYDTQTTSGTSFSSPIMAGAVASLWQAAPHATNYQLINALQLAGNQAKQPNDSLGYGIPDFVKALAALNDNIAYCNDNSKNNFIGTIASQNIFLVLPAEKTLDFIKIDILSQLGNLEKTYFYDTMKAQTRGFNLNIMGLKPGAYDIVCHYSKNDLPYRFAFCIKPW